MSKDTKSVQLAAGCQEVYMLKLSQGSNSHVVRGQGAGTAIGAGVGLAVDVVTLGLTGGLGTMLGGPQYWEGLKGKSSGEIRSVRSSSAGACATAWVRAVNERAVGCETERALDGVYVSFTSPSPQASRCMVCIDMHRRNHFGMAAGLQAFLHDVATDLVRAPGTQFSRAFGVSLEILDFPVYHDYAEKFY